MWNRCYSPKFEGMGPPEGEAVTIARHHGAKGCGSASHPLQTHGIVEVQVALQTQQFNTKVVVFVDGLTLDRILEEVFSKTAVA